MVMEHSAPTRPEVVTGTGPVRGRTVGGVSAFLGLPFAAPPVGPLRFQPPEPVKAWSAVREATEYGPTAPQPVATGPTWDLLPNVVIEGEDYLNLNVWTPDLTGSLPVMVFIHGGGFTQGSGSVPLYDGTNFARDGVVLVTINYRLGAEGFLWFGDGSANLGLLDQIAALRWVRDNIAAFGGDPGNVTIFGESAGGVSVLALLAIPAARGLFQRAIAQSGGGGQGAISADAAGKVAHRVAEILGVAPTREAVAQVPMARLLEAQQQVGNEVSKRPRAKLWGDAAELGMPFAPTVDKNILPKPPLDALIEGASAEIDLLIGSNLNEFRLYAVPTSLADKMNRLILTLALTTRLKARSVLKTYRRTRPSDTAGDLLSAIMTDVVFRVSVVRLVEARPNAHVYEFDWWSPGCDGRLGAAHAVELPFVFDNLSDPGCVGLLGPQPPQALADELHAVWTEFARTGQADWPTYSRQCRAVMTFGADTRLVLDPRAEEREAWTGLARP